MPLTKKAPRTLVVNEWSDPDPDADPGTFADDPPPVPLAESDPDLCPVCGDLLAWHEQACVPAAPTALALASPLPPDQPAGRAPAAGFAYALGQLVQLTPDRTA